MNIYPAEIEEVLQGMPGILDVAVVGKPDRHWGEIVAAFVVTEKQGAVTEEDIKAYCDERMANYKIPAVIRFIEEIPRSPQGKILKMELKKELDQAEE